MFMRLINRAEEAIICTMLILTTLLVFLDVVMRFGFNAGFMWSQELTLHMSAWMVLFGASYGLKVGSHIGMDAFVKLFPATGQRILSSIAAILALIYCWLVFYGSWMYLKKMKLIGIQRTNALSNESAMVPIDGRAPISSRRSVNLTDVNCDPASLCVTRPISR